MSESKIVAGMPVEEFRKAGHELIDWIAGYLEDIRDYPVLPSVQPGDIAAKLPASAPERGESMDAILEDFRNLIMESFAEEMNAIEDPELRGKAFQVCPQRPVSNDGVSGARMFAAYLCHGTEAVFNALLFHQPGDRDEILERRQLQAIADVRRRDVDLPEVPRRTDGGAGAVIVNKGWNSKALGKFLRQRTAL